MPVSTPTSVDLPAPFRPTSARESPAGTRIETSLSAWLVPKLFETPDTSTIAGPGTAVSEAGCITAHTSTAGRLLRTAQFLAPFAHRLGSSTLAFVTVGAGSKSIGLPLTISMRLSWSVGPAPKLLPATAPSR